jgi:hypothetical protein
MELFADRTANANVNSLSLDDLNKFKQITIEFHSINDNGLNIKKQLKHLCLKKLFETHYIIHAHGNNCCGTTNNIPNIIELTYVRKDVIGENVKYNKKNLPTKYLDYPNLSNNSDIDLNFYPFLSI